MSPLQMPSPGVDLPDSPHILENAASDHEAKIDDAGSNPAEEKPAGDGVQTELNETNMLVELEDSISSGGYQLDSILQKISEAALKLTSATGSAIAMWKDGAVVCRASFGDSAPPLGSRLSAESGISGHCLRSGLAQHCGETETDPRVDADLCRRLGLRSVAVLPIRGWRGVNGILEVFSTEPRAFREQHFELLEQLARLAERARSGQPTTDSGAFQIAVNEVAISPSRLLPASDRIRDLVSILLSSKRRPLVLAAAAVIGLLLIGFAIWLGWRNPESVKAKVSTSTAVSSSAMPASFKDSDPVWKPNPGGERLLTSTGQNAAGTASKVDIAPKHPRQNMQDTSTRSASDAPETVIHHDTPVAPVARSSPTVDEPPTVIAAVSPTTLDSLLTSSKPAPQLATVPISQGVSNGYIIRQVPPVYPQQALLERLEGNVVLNALIAEDGTVQDLKIVKGQPTLARAAIQAVRQWRYKPYQLDRKPVKVNTTITVKFKLP